MTEFISFEKLIALMPGHVYWLDHNNIYRGCNDAQAKAFKLSSREGICGKKNSDFSVSPREFAVIWDRNNLQVMNSGIEEIFEEPIITQEGMRVTVLSHKKPLFDEYGNVIGLLGASLDITEKHQFEIKLRKQKDELDITLENIISNLPGHIYWQDKNNVFLECNEAQAKSAGLKSRNDIIGKTNYDMPWSEQAEELNRINNEVMRTNKKYLVEEEAVLTDGKKAFFLSKKVPLIDTNGSVVGIMGMSFDITERKKMENELKEAKALAEAASRAKTEFLENMRHDIRTPLSGIIGMAEILNNENLDKNTIKEFTINLDRASKELLRFLNEVLESINVASGEIPLLQKRFSLRETLDNVIKLHQPIAIQKKLKLTFDLDEMIPKYLIGDPVRIYRIILELLVNALKFTSKGHVSVVAKLGKRTGQKIIVKIFVQDTGIGIPPEKQQDLFVHFIRLTPSYDGIYKGLGLGLSIVKKFLEDINGEIYVDSQVNKGTQFVCIISLKEPLLEEDPFSGSPSPLS